LNEVSDAVEQVQGAGGSLAHITGTASKVAEQACRIAGVLTLWQDINADEVRMTEMESGVALAKFYLSEASRLASAAVVSAEIDNAEKLRRWLLDSWTEPEVLVRNVLQQGPNALRETPKARASRSMGGWWRWKPERLSAELPERRRGGFSGEAECIWWRTCTKSARVRHMQRG
jgi:hypothetical protein